jgi:hypothetical protein
VEEIIITEYGEPPLAVVWKSGQLKALPAPEHSIGDIVIVPPGDYGVVLFFCPERENVPPQRWIYGVSCQEDWDRIYYFPAESVVKRGLDREDR